MINQFTFLGKVKEIHSFPAITLLSVEGLAEPNREEKPLINFNVTKVVTVCGKNFIDVGDTVAVKGYLSGGAPVELVAERVVIITKGDKKDEK